MGHYLILFIIVLLAGLVPAFGPPSWVFAVYFRYKYALAAVPIILITAIATTYGRLLLALFSRFLKLHIPKRYVRNLEYAKNIILSHKKSAWLTVGIFVISPLPSAQLFEAAGLVGTPLVPIGIAFFFGRLVTLSIYLGLAHITVSSLGNLWEKGLTSKWAILLEVVSLLFLFALLNLRWLITKINKLRKN